jgi:hypothetical protein
MAARHAFGNILCGFFSNVCVLEPLQRELAVMQLVQHRPEINNPHVSVLLAGEYARVPLRQAQVRNAVHEVIGTMEFLRSFQQVHVVSQA